MKTKEAAREELVGMLEVAGLRVKASYRRGEVCAALACCDRHFWDLVERFEPGPDGEPLRPDCLDSYMYCRERRVRFDELVAFLRRNTSYTRRNAAGHQQQMTLF